MVQECMQTISDLNTIPDDDLLHRLSRLVGQSRRVEADLVAHIGEVDQRRLYAREATSSMFAYCTEVLHLSEYEAYLRIAVARAARRHPVLLTMLRDGSLHLSAIDKLAPHLDGLDDARRARLLESAKHQSKRRVEELVAALAPKPDVPATVRKLPQRSVNAPAVQAPVRAEQLGPDPARCDQVAASTPPDVSTSPALAAPAASPEGVRSATVEPLAPARYKVTFTGSAELREKLERLRALMPDCDLAEIIEAAVTEKLARAEARRLGKVRSPRKSVDETDVSPGSRHVGAAVKRAVVARDGGRCTFVSADGRRCGARRGLEFHHDEPFALGGDRSPDNIRQLCAVARSRRCRKAWAPTAIRGRRRT